MLAQDDKYKVVGIDLQYTDGCAGYDRKLVVAQLCVLHHVLVYHYSLSTRTCERFTRFVNSPDYKFAMVETINDVKTLKVTGLARKKLWTLQGLGQQEGEGLPY